MDNKINNAYKTIGEVARELGLINPKNGNLRTHTIRFWETQFKQIRPTIRAGNRRYYSNKDFKIIKEKFTFEHVFLDFFSVITGYISLKIFGDKNYDNWINKIGYRLDVFFSKTFDFRDFFSVFVAFFVNFFSNYVRY